MKKLVLLTILVLSLFIARDVYAVPQSFSPVVKKTAPSVVNISTTKTVTRRVDPFFDNFFGMFGGDPFGGFGGGNQPRERQFKSSALGSGFVVDREGYVVTNNHVIEGADEIIIKFPNDKEYKAKIVGTDPLTDLALLKFDPKNDVIQPIVLGNSDDIEIGDWVIAIGNPLGLGGTVTAGILSAKGRVLGDGPYDNFLQTDVSINPGNSGGPLINMEGEVIGINTAIIQNSQGLGFAVPVNMLKNIINKLKSGKVTRGWLGISLQPLDENLAKSFGLPNTNGALIAEVTQGEPAHKAGLQSGDIIVGINGKEVKDVRVVTTTVGALSPNDTVRLDIIRDGNKRTINVTLGERPGNDVASNNAQAPKTSADISVKPLDSKAAQSLGIKSGVIVTDVKQDSSAFAAGVRPGDIIISLNRKDVTSPEAFYDQYSKIKKGQLLAMKLISGNSSRFIAFNK